MTTQATLPNPTTKKSYWVENFKVQDDDLEFIFNTFLETETPLSLRDITHKLIEYRIKQEKSRIRRQVENGVIFQPRHDYETDQIVTFPALDYVTGEVKSKRPGRNPEHGEFSVIEVAFESGETREFACNMEAHDLNLDKENIFEETADPNTILRYFGRAIARKVKAAFDADDDVVYLAGRWFLKSLLANIDVGHLHLAEAVLDVNEGGPLTTAEIIKEIGVGEAANPRLQTFSLDYAMQQDERFDEVGPAGQVLWYLTRMQPEEVRKPPLQLRYDSLPYDPSLLDDELRNILLDIDDELSPIELVDDEFEEVTLTLTYPYRRTGTLPLSARVNNLFPTAYESRRILMTMIDVQSGEEFEGWVVRELGYVYGFWDFFEQYKMPVGAYITLRRHEDPTRLIIDFPRRPRPRTEWIKLAVPESNRLRFENMKRPIEADYDELMNFGVEDVEGVDALWSKYADLPLHVILKRLLPELAALNPQQAVHVATVYSAVNLLRRCPPDPIFSTLVDSPDFEHAGGPYWRIAAQS